MASKKLDEQIYSFPEFPLKEDFVSAESEMYHYMLYTEEYIREEKKVFARSCKNARLMILKQTESVIWATALHGMWSGARTEELTVKCHFQPVN